MTLVGLGSIGREIATRAHAFGIEVRGVRRRTSLPMPRGVASVFSPDQIDDALRGSNILVLAAPAGPSTTGLIDARRLALLAPDALIANVARGQIILEQALIDALVSGHLGGAFLDVFDREPLEPQHVLWSLPNVVVSPHVSGFRAGHWDDVIELFEDNMKRFRNGEPLRNLVDCAAGY
jgi:phosphoglycerate dehydrogenase-like enzyme